jgi:thiamine-monophosphate kinase
MHEKSAISEFDLIRHYFADLTPSRADVSLGIGDDAAVVCVPPDQRLAVSIDTLVSGVHFLPTVSPRALGHKSLAVNLSDLAAMGAEPAWATLALTLPAADASWLQGFADGFATLARRYGVTLIGGDTTRGPLSLTVQVHGFVPEQGVLRRCGAQPGDGVYVTGCLGDAALFLKLQQSGKPLSHDIETLRQRLERPEPRVEAGMALRELASSAIDISDGLLADLGHILEASGVGARLMLEQLPLSAPYVDWLSRSGDWMPALAGGDDYELCFTAAPEREAQIGRIAGELGLPMRRVGTIEQAQGLRVQMPDGSPWTGSAMGFDHFAEGDWNVE